MNRKFIISKWDHKNSPKSKKSLSPKINDD